MSKLRYSVYSLLLALVAGGAIIAALGSSPLQIYGAVLTGSFGSGKSMMTVFAYTIPLIFTGLGSAVAFSGGVFNIGGEGQLLVGGLAAVLTGIYVDLPAPFGILVALLAGMAAGALWALLPTLLVGRNLNTLAVGTIMMNSIGELFTEFIVKYYFLREGATNTETNYVTDGAILPRFNSNTQLNYGIIIALILVLLVAWLLYRTPGGYCIRCIGANRRAAQQAGINVYKTTLATMAISGAICGLAGAVQCLAIYKRFMMGFSPGYGWDGITVATLAGNSPFGVVLTAFLFGMLRSASISMSLTNAVPVDLITIIQGLVVVLVASPMIWNTLGNLLDRFIKTLGLGRHQPTVMETVKGGE